MFEVSVGDTIKIIDDMIKHSIIDIKSTCLKYLFMGDFIYNIYLLYLLDQSEPPCWFMDKYKTRMVEIAYLNKNERVSLIDDLIVNHLVRVNKYCMDIVFKRDLYNVCLIYSIRGVKPPGWLIRNYKLSNEPDIFNKIINEDKFKILKDMYYDNIINDKYCLQGLFLGIPQELNIYYLYNEKNREPPTWFIKKYPLTEMF